MELEQVRVGESINPGGFGMQVVISKQNSMNISNINSPQSCITSIGTSLQLATDDYDYDYDYDYDDGDYEHDDDVDTAITSVSMPGRGHWPDELWRIVVEEDAPSTTSESAEKKLSWVRSQIIGADAEFESPFGRRRLTYADHTASARSLLFVENYIIHKLLPFYGNSHTSDSYVGQRTTKMVKEAREFVKKCMGGGPDDALFFCGSGSTAAIKRLQEVMGIAIPSTMRERALECLRVEERWVVFVGPYEHHSNLLSWRQTIAEVIEIGIDHSTGLIDVEALRRQLDLYKPTNRPMLGSFSACSNVTGVYTHTRLLAALLHQYRAFACFDFAASGPYVEIDMRSKERDGYDAVFLSPHKFLAGPGSPGILLMTKALYQLGSSPPSTCGGGTVNYVNGFNEKDTLYVESIEERENAGTPPIIQTARAALAFWVKEYVGYQVIAKQEHGYIQEAIRRLLPNHNIWILGNNTTTAKRQAILSFLIYSTTYSCDEADTTSNLNNAIDGGEERGLFMWRETGNKRDKPLPGPFVAKLLNDLFGIQTRGGCACAGPYGHILLNVDESHSLAFRSTIQMGYNGVKPGWTRVSFPYYMSREEFEFILAALEFVSIYGQRFLPLYHLNWKTGDWTFKKGAFKETLHEYNMPDLNKELDSGHQLNQHEHGKTDVIDVGVQNKYYLSYLDAAKHIANLLPKFPPQSRIPQGIDPDLLPFRV